METNPRIDDVGAIVQHHDVEGRAMRAPHLQSARGREAAGRLSPRCVRAVQRPASLTLPPVLQVDHEQAGL